MGNGTVPAWLGRDSATGHERSSSTLPRGGLMKAVTKAIGGVGTGLLLLLGASVGTASAGGQCSPDAVLAGTTCIDKYEASVWFVPKTFTTLIAKIRDGSATLADLTSPRAVA